MTYRFGVPWLQHQRELVDIILSVVEVQGQLYVRKNGKQTFLLDWVGYGRLVSWDIPPTEGKHNILLLWAQETCQSCVQLLGKQISRVNTTQAGEAHAAARSLHLRTGTALTLTPQVRRAACWPHAEREICSKDHPYTKRFFSSSSVLMRDLREATRWTQKLQDSSRRGARLEGFQILFWSNFVPQEGS